jgi:heterodisulfide reductase subunit A-like polyferredoxin/coenzyme F420-reducing hydrogenase delta subunit
MKGSVLIIGAGVAGMRAASELVQQKFKVYLLERLSSIGGKMALIERLYPSKEHSACALQPLRLNLINNPKVTLLTSAELLSLQGQPGNFTVEVLVEQTEEKDLTHKLTFSVGAIIIATGLEEERIEPLKQLGYGRLPNVITGLELERQLLGFGPTNGSVRLANGKEPGSVTWIVNDMETPVPFMSAMVQALTVREKNNDTQVSILFKKNIINGKRYDEFYQETKKQGVKYIQVSSVVVDNALADQLTISYTNRKGKKAPLKSEMLVLSATLQPGKKTRVLAKRLGLELDEKGYFKRDPASGFALLSCREGIFMCGTAQGPKGIGESVIQACAAASHAAALLSAAKSSELIDPFEKKLLPVKVTDEPKIAVLIDQDGKHIEDHLDLGDLKEYTRILSGVEQVELTPRASDGVKIKELLNSGDFNRFLVAGPSPISHERLFQDYAEKAGLNRYLLEMVNLQTHCAQVHSGDTIAATEKAKILMKMGVVRARQLEPLEELQFIITQSCLVIGGSPSGVACAVKIAEMGIYVHLIEKKSNLEEVPGNDHPLVKSLLSALLADHKVEVHAPATVNDVQGYLGNFDVSFLQQENEMGVTVGAIVLATRTDIDSDTNFEESLALEKNKEGFYLSTEGILNLLDFVTEGVFNCGPARAVLGIEKAIIDGEAVASRVASVLASTLITRPPTISCVVEKNCDGCAYCIEPCPTRSLTLLDYIYRNQIKKVAEVNTATCIGCGICMATCPKQGILVKHFKSEYFSEMVKAAQSGNEDEPVIVSFCCNRCAYPGSDAAGLAGIQYPTSVRIVRTVCLGMIHPNIVVDALSQGIDGVLLCGCHPGNCRSREGIRKALARAKSIELMLEDFALEPERFRLTFIAASEGHKFAKIVKEMTEELNALGPNPYK